MKKMRDKRRKSGLREIRLIVPDARSRTVRKQVAQEVARLDTANEEAAMQWIEAVSEFDNP